MNKSGIIGIVIIVIMVVSTFSYTILQSVSAPKMPDTNIAGSLLDSKVKSTLIGNGATVMTLEYNSICENCLEQKYFLEQVTNEFKTPVLYKSGSTIIYPIYLEEIVNENVSLPKLSMVSNWGSKELINATQDEIFYSLCDLLTNPPVICAAR